MNFGGRLEDITVLGASEQLFDAPDRKASKIETVCLIMKDGKSYKIYKNTLN